MTKSYESEDLQKFERKIENYQIAFEKKESEMENKIAILKEENLTLTRTLNKMHEQIKNIEASQVVTPSKPSIVNTTESLD